MVAGLTIRNDAGTVQIDETWRNFGFVQVIPVTVTASYFNPPGPGTASVVVSGENVLVACRATSVCPVMMRSYFDGTNYTYNWIFLPEFAGTVVTETVEFYVFNTLAGGYGNVGMEVFDASGARVFHSDADMMKVAGIVSGNTAFIGVPGRSYVPLIERNGVFAAYYGFPMGWRLRANALRVSGSNITSHEVGLESWGAPGAGGSAGSYAVIDVTGLS